MSPLRASSLPLMPASPRPVEPLVGIDLHEGVVPFRPLLVVHQESFMSVIFISGPTSVASLSE